MAPASGAEGSADKNREGWLVVYKKFIANTGHCTCEEIMESKVFINSKHRLKANKFTFQCWQPLELR